MNETIKKHWYDILEDDSTETGGTSHSNETLGEFILEMFDKEKHNQLTIDKVNWYLVDCGIKPIVSLD